MLIDVHSCDCVWLPFSTIFFSLLILWLFRSFCIHKNFTTSQDSICNVWFNTWNECVYGIHFIHATYLVPTTSSLHKEKKTEKKSIQHYLQLTSNSHRPCTQVCLMRYVLCYASLIRTAFRFFSSYSASRARFFHSFHFFGFFSKKKKKLYICIVFIYIVVWFVSSLLNACSLSQTVLCVDCAWNKHVSGGICCVSCTYLCDRRKKNA